MTPWKTPQERVRWLLSPNSTGARVPRAIYDRNSKRYTGNRVHLIGPYYIQSIYDSNFYRITWQDSNGVDHEKLMRSYQIIEWVQVTSGERSPNTNYAVPMLTVAQICQLYNVNPNIVRSKLAGVAPDVLVRNTSRGEGDHWLVKRDFAQALFQNYGRRK